MAGKAPNNTILLSVRSPIFAPLYLAKVRGNAFRNIDFEYAFESRTYGSEARPENNGLDDLAYRVLSRAPENERYIAGVADPFRCLVLESDVGLYEPKILGSIVRHQTFWLAGDQNARSAVSAPEEIGNCRYIVSQPKYTSGYAVLRNFLQTVVFKGKSPTIADADSCYEIGDLGVYHKTFAGFERLHYEYISRKSCRHASYAYLTTNPADFDSAIVAFSNKQYGEPYENTLMSALFCGSSVYRKYPMLFDDIRGDITRAIEAIRFDPIGVAVELKDYASISGDQFMDFSNKKIRHQRLVDILDDLQSDGIYAPGLLLSSEDVARGAEMRRHFLDARARSPTAALYPSYLDELMAQYFDPRCVRWPSKDGAEAKPAAAAGDKERSEDLPLFAQHIARNYRKMADKHYGAPAREPVIRATPGMPTGFWSAIEYLESHLDIIFLTLGGLFAVPCTFGALGLYRPLWLSSFSAKLCPTCQWQPPWTYWQWFAPEFFMTVLSLVLLVFAYLLRYGKTTRKSLGFDLCLTLGAYINTSVVVWALMIMLDSRLVASTPVIKDGQIVYEHLMGISDQMSVELFLFSILILTFGALWLAASERITDVWKNFVLGHAEKRIENKVKNKSNLPPACGKVPLCHACPRARATSGRAGIRLPAA